MIEHILLSYGRKYVDDGKFGKGYMVFNFAKPTFPNTYFFYAKNGPNEFATVPVQGGSKLG